ncbi:MAG: hypothetical protein H2174_03195 [Vampirovibrio sp.]|nr:hypothetical protein [Vampirovibrio sp.]
MLNGINGMPIMPNYSVQQASYKVSLRSGVKSDFLGCKQSTVTQPSPLPLTDKIASKKLSFSAQGFGTGAAILGIGAGIVSYFSTSSDDLTAGMVQFQAKEGFRILSKHSAFNHEENQTHLHLKVEDKHTQNIYNLAVVVSQIPPHQQSTIATMKTLSYSDNQLLQEIPKRSLTFTDEGDCHLHFLRAANEENGVIDTLVGALTEEEEGQETNKPIPMTPEDIYMREMQTKFMRRVQEKESWGIDVKIKQGQHEASITLSPPLESLFKQQHYTTNLSDALEILKNGEQKSCEIITVWEGLTSEEIKKIVSSELKLSKQDIEKGAILSIVEQSFFPSFFEKELPSILKVLTELSLPKAETMITYNIKMNKSKTAVVTIAGIAAGIGGVLGGWGKSLFEKWQHRNHQHGKPKASNQGKPTETLRQIITE